MKIILVTVAVMAMLSVGKAVPSDLANLLEKIMTQKKDEASAQTASLSNILKELLAVEQNKEEAKAAIACLPGPLPICSSFLEPEFCCEQPKVLCDVCEWLGYEGCCPPQPESPFIILKKEPEPELEPEPEVRIAMIDEEAMAATVCLKDPLPLCESVQSPPFCCKHPPVKCALCKDLGLSPCCPPFPPHIIIGLDKEPESGKKPESGK